VAIFYDICRKKDNRGNFNRNGRVERGRVELERAAQTRPVFDILLFNLLIIVLQRQFYHQGSSLTDLADGIYLALMFGNDTVTDAQPQSGSLA
jgi:hypothetical protein